MKPQASNGNFERLNNYNHHQKGEYENCYCWVLKTFPITVSPKRTSPHISLCPLLTSPVPLTTKPNACHNHFKDSVTWYFFFVAQSNIICFCSAVSWNNSNVQHSLTHPCTNWQLLTWTDFSSMSSLNEQSNCTWVSIQSYSQLFQFLNAVT